MNPISSVSAAYGGRQRLARLADVLRLRRHRQLAVGEAQPQRRVALRHHATRGARRRAAPRAAAGARARTAPAAAGGSSGTARRCGASSARRRRVPKTTWFSWTPSWISSAPAAEARQLLERAGRDDRLELRQRALDGGLLDREPVRVGCRHHELARLELDEDAGQHGPALVARRRAADTRDRLERARRGRPAGAATASISGSRGKSSAEYVCMR